MATVLVYHYIDDEGRSSWSACHPGREAEAVHGDGLATALGALLLAQPAEGLTVRRDDTRDFLSRLADRPD